ncbi:MAG: pseudouridine synthase [Eubacterium sp.]|nr:pseudouridine synthase [Eubacterium sp.]
MRLQKYMAQCGVASRRKSEALIAEGRVTVDGVVVTTPGYDVDPAENAVCVDGRPVAQDQKIYIMLNKPKGVVCTSEDRHADRTVMELLPHRERLFTVGRLDKDTEGLLILTNDGDLTFRLTHPSHEFEKTYLCLVKGHPGEEALRALASGVDIDNEGEVYRTAPARVRLVRTTRGGTKIEMTIHEGKKRQVRKMCAAVGHPVVALKRVSVGRLTLEGLGTGKWRELSPQEIAYLKGEEADD